MEGEENTQNEHGKVSLEVGWPCLRLVPALSRLPAPKGQVGSRVGPCPGSQPIPTGQVGRWVGPCPGRQPAPTGQVGREAVPLMAGCGPACMGLMDLKRSSMNFWAAPGPDCCRPDPDCS
jgi:hypothetical protein